MVIKGEKVILRPIRLSDAPRFVKWLRDPEVNKFTTRKSILLKEEVRWIKSLKKKKDEVVFSVDVLGGPHIGSVSLGVDWGDRNALFGILIGDKEYWDKGLGSEATKLILDHAFKKLKMHKVSLGVFDYNKRAIKVYNRLGFKLEGASRDDIFYKNKFHDRLQMGILEKEWAKHKKRRVGK
ncbi:MAG: GNAT family protein [bacterium]|nr:GNAT family protein [bacterium]